LSRRWHTLGLFARFRLLKRCYIHRLWPDACKSQAVACIYWLDLRGRWVLIPLKSRCRASSIQLQRRSNTITITIWQTQ
jgi:hypothetical protein